MTTTLTARGPEDLLAAVPVVLGFHPQESLVMLTFGALRSFHARLDLPSAPDDEEMAEVRAEALAHHDPQYRDVGGVVGRGVGGDLPAAGA